MKKEIKFFLICAFLLFSEMFFFRNVIGNNNLFGDDGDGLLTTLITEHWFSFFCNKESFADLLMMYPAKNTIGYTDMFLGFGLIHSVFRLLNFDMWLSFKYTLIFVHTLGTFCTYYFCRKKLNISILWSLFATVAFSYSNAYSLFVGHAQLFAISILPLLSILLFDSVSAVMAQKRYSLSVFLFLTLFILLMYNSWYIAFFSYLFLLVFIITYTVLVKINKLSFKPFIRRISTMLAECTVYGIFSLILLIPFFVIYSYTLSKIKGFPYHDITGYLPSIIDYIRVGEQNMLLGLLMENMDPVNGERIIGFSIILLSLFIAMFFVSWQKITELQQNKTTSPHDKYILLIIKSCFISIIVCLLLMVRTDFNDWSLWYFVHTFIPGGNSVRAIARFAFWLSFPMAIITAYSADKFWKFKKYAGRECVVILFIALLWVSNINKVGVSSNWNKKARDEFIQSIPPPPTDLESFFITGVDYQKSNNVYESMVAFEIATYYRIKTLNGYPCRNPANWHLLDKDNYNASVRNWVILNKLKNVYTYNVEKHQWIKYDDYMANVAF